MSYTEINSREGLPYGGMPYDVILNKLEETDPELVDEVRGLDELHAMEDNYDDYVRGEIIDWSPDAPFLESDHPVRDPAVSRSRLNLLHNGTRGSHPELPRHPELFIGFTGNDPRGRVNDPRFDEVRGQITSRAADLAVRFGNNDDFALAERPWTNQSISYAMKEVHRRVKGNTKVFSVEKEGRPWGNNVVANEFASGQVRAGALDAGTESFQDGDARFVAGDHGGAADRFSDGVRGMRGADGHAAAPWRHSVTDTDLGVHRHGQTRGAGRTTLGGNAVGGGRVLSAAADQDWAVSRRARSANRQTLGATVAAAARYHRATRSRAHDQDPGVAYEQRGMPGAGLAPARDVARAFRHGTEDQSRRPAGTIQDGAGGELGGARGLTPGRTAVAPRHTVSSTTPNGHLTNAESIVAGLREGTAAGRRRIAGMVVTDGARHLALAEVGSDGVVGGGLAPGADVGRVGRETSMRVSRAAAAEGLEVHSYRGAAPQRTRDVAHGRAAYDTGTWRGSREALPVGMSRAPTWRSATQGQTDLGDLPENVFGAAADVGGLNGGAPVGPKRLRSQAWSDSAGLSDELGEGFDRYDDDNGIAV